MFNKVGQVVDIQVTIPFGNLPLQGGKDQLDPSRRVLRGLNGPDTETVDIDDTRAIRA